MQKEWLAQMEKEKESAGRLQVNGGMTRGNSQGSAQVGKVPSEAESLRASLVKRISLPY